MPNIKSAIKRVKVTKSKTLQNSMFKSALKTSIKKTKEGLVKKEANAAELVKETVISLDKAVAKNILHKNTAARKKSKLAKAMNKV